MSLPTYIEGLSADNAQKLKIIQEQQEATSICPNIDYIEQNLEAFSKVSAQFYNPEVHQALTCLLQTFIKKQKAVSTGKDYFEKFITQIQGFFTSRKNGGEVLKQLTLRTVTTQPGAIRHAQQIDELINEAYVGIKYLNNLRAITPCFKYIYVIFVRHDGGVITPYIIEEALEDAQSVDVVLSKLSADDLGVRTVKSIMLQLITAVHYASKHNVSNFPMEIVIRSVSESLSPIFLENSIIYLNTYGCVPVFKRYQTAGSPLDGGIERPKSLYQDQNEIFQYIISTLKRVNPKLSKLIRCNNSVNIQFFNEVTKSREDIPQDIPILTCNESARVATCMNIKEIIRYFTVPFSRVDTYVKSALTRVDELRAILSRTDTSIDARFIISPVIIRYSQLLRDVSDNVDGETRKRLFLPERYYERGISDDRYQDLNQLLIKSDLVYINESINMAHSQYSDARYIKDFLDRAVSTGNKLRAEQQNISRPDFTTRQGLLTGIQNMRKLIANIFYFETTDAIIENYRQQIGTYRIDFTDAINEAQFLKEKYEIWFSDAGYVINNFVETIYNDDDAVLVRLYDIFIEDIREPLETELYNYEVGLDTNELTALNYEVYNQKLLASDPIPLL